MIKLLTLEQIKSAVVECMPQDFISKVFLFGSYARGEADENSDVDLHIWTKNNCTLTTIGIFRLDLVEKLGIEVDIVANILKRNSPFQRKFADNVNDEEILLYAE